jgi:hypothetical protein
VTEAEWATASDPEAMLAEVRASTCGTERKFRLFAVACCHAAAPRLPDRRSRRVVQTCERFADGAVGAEKLRAAWGDARWAAHALERKGVAAGVLWVVAQLAEPDIARVLFAVGYAARLGGWDSQRPVQAALLRDVFGPVPYRSVAVEPGWLTWNHGTVPAIARHVYDDRAWHDLPILADALEDAGCNDQDILGLCRSGGEHARGCWVVDLMLGKE